MSDITCQRRSGAISPPEMSPITHLIAGVPVSDLDVKIPDPDGNAIAFAEPPGA
jgi:hypothetical protein